MYIISLDMHVPIFDKAAIEYGTNEKNFIYWIKFYNHNVYSLDEEERPAKHIIKYNPLMDEFVERKVFKEKQKDKERKHGSKEVYNVN